MPSSRPSRPSRLQQAGTSLCLAAILAGSVLLPTSARAQAATPPPELSQGLSDELGKLKDALKADDPSTYPELLRKIEDIISRLKLKDYDLAYTNRLRANLMIRSGQAIKAIPVVEQSISGGYFPPGETLGLSLALCQLYMQDAGTTSDEKHREIRLGQTRDRLNAWFAATPEPVLGDSDKMGPYTDAMELYANCLYFLKEYQKSYEASLKLVRLSIEPKDQAWILLFAAQQEAGKNADAAETFEMFIRKFPEKKDYWLQLTQAYLSSDQAIRAILTYQRAQANGFQNQPADYMNVFGLYYRLEEFSRASQLLESWIKSGKVEDNEDNWELVSVCMQNLRREDAVRTILDSARKRFKTGNLDYQLAQYLWYDGKYKEGLAVATTAWKKGGLKKPGKAALFLATANFEQRNYELALEFFGIAEKSSDNDKRDLDRVRKILQEAVEIIRSRTPEGAAPAAKS